MAGKRARPSVLIIGSEARPFSKTGGLADVLGALPPALARLGWNVTLVVPRYRGVAAGAIAERFPVTVGAYTRDAGFHEAPLADGARAILVECDDLYDRLTSFDDVYAAIVERVLEAARCGDVVFAVPGHPQFAIA